MIDADSPRVRDAPERWKKPPARVPEGAPFHVAIEALLGNPYSRTVYVVDAEGRLRGALSFRDALRIANARRGVQKGGFLSFGRYWRDLAATTVDQLMRKVTPVRPDASLKDALFIMEMEEQTAIPVVDEEDRLVGEVNGLQVLDAALDVVRRGDAAAVPDEKPPAGPP